MTCLKERAIALFNKLDAGDGFPPVKGKAVYAVFVSNFRPFSEHLFYIGSSQDIEKRRKNEKHPYMRMFRRFHGKRMVVFIKYFYSETYREDESVLIKYFKPILNKSGK